MTDGTPEEGERPGQFVLDEAIDAAIKKVRHEWGLTHYEIVGVLTIIAARYSHMCVSHDDD